MGAANSMARKLEDLLQTEYEALMEGQIDALEALGGEKHDILLKISALPVADLTAFDGFRAKLIRNQLLIQSAIEGMRSAIERAKEVTEISARLKTYDGAGRKQSVAMQAGTALSKRS